MSRGRRNYNNPSTGGDRSSQSYDQQGNLQPEIRTLTRRQEAVDSWRSYGGDQNSLRPNPAEQHHHGNVAFDPYTQVFHSDRQTNGYETHAQYQPQSSPYYQPANVVTARQAPTQPHFRPYQPLRFSNGAQERQSLQTSALSQTSGGQHGQPTQHQIAYRPRGSGRGRNHTRQFSTERVYQSVEQGEANLRAPPSYPKGSRRGFGRQSTPRRADDTASPPPVPHATESYLDQAKLPADLRQKPQKLLVILDLNGTLIFKPDRRNPGNFRLRPGVPKLLDYLFKNHIVMIYTSSQPRNAKTVVNKLFKPEQLSKLADMWARDKLDLNQTQFRSKVQVYKKLEKVWSSKIVQASCPDGGKWNQGNTVLVDDSHLKALAQPHNLLQVPEYISKPLTKETPMDVYDAEQDAILQGLILKLEELKFQVDVSRLIRQWQTGEAVIPIVPGTDIFVDEKVDQKELAEKTLAEKAVADAAERLAATQLATPPSPDSTSDGGVDTSKNQHSRETRIESPIPDEVRSELLAGEKSSKKDAADIIPTAKSQDG